MMEQVMIKKILNNNVLIATHPAHDELVLIGKGIGFGKKAGDFIAKEQVEKTYMLENEREQEQYKKLLPQLSEEFISFMNDIFQYIEHKMEKKLNEHIHIALTDHIAFAFKRLEEGLDLKNPFLLETKALYPKEYAIAEDVIQFIKREKAIDLPEGEIGFIALHIHSASTDQSLSDVQSGSQLINQMIAMIENGLGLVLDKQSVHFMRLVRHLHHTIERIKTGEMVKEPEKLTKVLKEEYPICYNLAWKVMKVMQKSLNQKVDDAEAVYLTLHLQRLSHKTE